MSRRALAALGLGLAVLVVGLSPSSAQDTSGAAARLVITRLTSLLGPGVLPPDAPLDAAPETVDLRVLVENTGGEPLADLRLVVEVFAPVGTRSALHAALDEGAPGNKRDTISLPVRESGELGVGDIAGIDLSRTTRELGIVGGRSVVFPVRVSVQQGIDTLDTVTTAVVYLPERPAEPLRTAIVWPFDDALWRAPGGTYPAGVEDAIAPTGRLTRLLEAAEAHPTVPLTFAPAAHLLEDLADRADGFTMTAEGEPVAVAAEDPAAQSSAAFLQRLRELLLDAPLDPVTSAYADADLGGLVDAPAPLDGEAASAVSRGRQRLTTQLGRPPDPSTYWSTTPVDRDVVDVLVDQTATEQVLLPFEQTGFAQEDLDQFPELPGPVTALTTVTGRRLLALVPDPYVDRALRQPDDEHGPLVAARRILAETAVLWTEAPNAPRPLLMLPPPDWDPFGRSANALLDTIAAAPWLRVGAPASLLEVAEARSGDLPTDVGDLASGFVQRLLETRRQLGAVQQALPSDDRLVADRTVAELETQLLRAPSMWLPTSRAVAMVADTQQAIDDAFGDVEVATGAQITLTSDTGQVPVTIQRPEGGPLNVVVKLGGPSIGRPQIQWPNGISQEVRLSGGGATTISFAVAARSTGRFTFDVEVWDPEEVRLLARGDITIQSTAISGPALVGTAAVVVALLLIGLVRRSSRRPKLEVVNGQRDD